MDPRHKKRIEILENLFSYSFDHKKEHFPHQEDQTSQKVIDKIDLIDKQIQKFAPKFPIDKIAKIDLSILRLSIYDLLIDKKQPAKVVIDEAVELAKEFGGDKSYGFINAILGKIYSDRNKQ